jgi:hypothetical protein
MVNKGTQPNNRSGIKNRDLPLPPKSPRTHSSCNVALTHYLLDSKLEVLMREQDYSATYMAAMEAATAELDGLFEEAKRLRNRMEQIDSVINALKPVVASDSGSAGMTPELNPTRQQIDAALGMVLV